ncbi:MAG: prolyl oligopeptidase family serine peptidase [Gemmatimonadales bacterium]
MRRTLVTIVLLAAWASVAPAQNAKRPMDHDVYDSWNRISDRQLRDDGNWFLYALVPQEGDAELHVHSLSSTTEYVVPRGREARFSPDGGSVVFLIRPELALVREAKKENKKPEDQPKDSLGILDLNTGAVTRIERVRSFELPYEEGGWVAYLLEQAEEPDSAEAGERPKQEEEQREERDKEKDKEEGTTLVLRDLSTGEEQRFAYVTEYALSQQGVYLAFTVSSKDGSADGVFVVRAPNGTVDTLLQGEGTYMSVVFDDDGEQLAFLSNRDDYDSDQPAFTLYRWSANEREVSMVATEGTPGIAEGWWVSEHGELEFSKDGRRLFFGTAPRPEPEPEEETPEWEKVEVDVWNWLDPLLQPDQLVDREDELKRSYKAVAHLRSGRVVQLADEGIPEVEVGLDGDAPVGIANTNVPYRQLISWDWPAYNDVYAVDVETGERALLLKKLQGDAELSSDAKYIGWWDGHERAWFAMPVGGGEAVNLTASIPQRFDYELHDWPMIPHSYGAAGWTEDDRWVLIYDKYDIWAVDPSGRRAPRNVTEGMGREADVRYRYLRVDPDEDAIPLDDPILLSVFDMATKASGAARDLVNGDEPPVRLVMQERRFGSVRKAADADVLVFTRESFREFPDLWVSDGSFDEMRRVSDANPQLSEYLWGTAELVHWRSTDGKELDGILYKPESFDPMKKYPMMVYFYEKMSNTLHSFRSVGPGGSSISVPFYVSRGYVVFIPDIHYRVGYPGESAFDCLVPGVLSIVARGFVDPERIGIQGHSWGGYQTAYLVTQTDMFAAAEAGAPVVNMTSAYGGIRWGSGLSRMFQYEKSQSRLGGSLWETRARYVENSPLFWADRINTPVLMLHNDEDTAVPWYQGIEFFVALRRLGKPAWLLNYNGEPHGLRKYQNRKDWAIRMQQFFDHYLMDAPPPVWLVEGVPAVEKGRTLGLELVEGEPAVTSGQTGREP